MIMRIGVLVGILSLGAVAYYWSATPERVAKPLGASRVVPSTEVAAHGAVVAPEVVAAPKVVVTPKVVAPDGGTSEHKEPTNRRPPARGPKPALPDRVPRRTRFQQAKWDELNMVLRSHLPEDVVVEAAKLLVDHCLERAAVPPPTSESTASDEEYVAKMRAWAIETRSLGKAIELDQLIPDAETKQKIYTPQFMGLVKDSCPSQ